MILDEQLEEVDTDVLRVERVHMDRAQPDPERVSGQHTARAHAHSAWSVDGCRSRVRIQAISRSISARATLSWNAGMFENATPSAD